ncbi:hypothetical protein M8332_06495 [Fructilactobacillus ixorae]|uniref:RsbT co-antagonist protein RsbRD N-terminal domain-containing protein n=1 Tax=Fructilactobacillus ixorae TaxID=1750535 RepID=A0ABY5C465_9LACO|nr:hypothetical protein [Fructilactobacillus ixorae]USS93236.1 hypothetical protein M8332_06495 [Fructilactobacillus ixorae]
MDKEQQVQQVGALIDQWLDQIDAEPDVAKLTPQAIQNVDTIIDSFVEIAMVGLDKQPEQWDDQFVGDVMFSRFMVILEADEQTQALYDLIPFALKKLFGYLRDQGKLPNAAHLIDWVNINAKGLQSLFNPKFDQFYRDLTTAMRREGINVQDHQAVDDFTKLYLKQHPDVGIKLYSDSDK